MVNSVQVERLSLLAQHLGVEREEFEAATEEELCLKFKAHSAHKLAIAMCRCRPTDKELRALLNCGDESVRRCTAHWVFTGGWQFLEPMRVSAAAF